VIRCRERLARCLLVVSIAATLGQGAVHASDPPPKALAAEVNGFLEFARNRLDRATALKHSYVTGVEGWLFLVPELRAMTVGPFWGKQAAAVSRANNRKYADPLAAIVDFDRQLKAAGIQLVVVPVPAKASVYPEKLSPLVKIGRDRSPPRLDPYHRQFHRVLKQRGVGLLDLLPVFLKRRDDRAGPLYCRTDSHWSGRGAAIAAVALLDTLKKAQWRKGLVRFKSAAETRPVTITGDLARLQSPDDPVTETLPLTFAGSSGKNGKPQPVPVSRSSPVLVMGDSHTLVFHDPALFARGAGFPDHVAAGLGIPVDLVGVRGSGATATRITLLRRRDNLQGKKLVIWCFSIREYTESFSGWRKVPVIRRR
jgi:alginate O-acetyltransferase complex protein AlgJ